MALAQLLSQAEESGATSAMGYAGDVLASDAWAALSDDDAAVVVDVRTQPEWNFVGLPNLSSLGRKVLPISWRIYPEMDVNNSFVAELEKRGISKDSPIFMLCRTGGRSREAAIAATAEGYRFCFNIAYGFEGDVSSEGKRGTVNGWKAEGLAWQQA